MRERQIRCIVFDFAATLCSELYFLPLGTEFLNIVQEEIFKRGNEQWVDPWIRGELNSTDIADYLSTLTDIPAEHILSGLDEGCAQLNMNPAIWLFAQVQRKLGRQTALVTLNMDVFSRVIVPAFGFDQIFDIVVNSADYREDNKIKLWEIAFTQLEGCSFENSLLIDDGIKNIANFRAHGGMAYQYTSDDAFIEWETNEWTTCDAD
jgi:FMN phosphatase YigB (HAD superfamily)